MRLLIAFGLSVFSLIAQGQLYRWTDASGKVHYTDTKPPASAKNVEKKAAARADGDKPDAAAQRSYALQQAMEKFPVTVYTAADCGDPCANGLALLKKRGIPFTERRVATREEIDALVKLAGAAQVPVMVVGASVLKDFQRQDWGEALDVAGYPKDAPPEAAPDTTGKP